MLALCHPLVVDLATSDDPPDLARLLDWSLTTRQELYLTWALEMTRLHTLSENLHGPGTAWDWPRWDCGTCGTASTCEFRVCPRGCGSPRPYSAWHGCDEGAPTWPCERCGGFVHLPLTWCPVCTYHDGRPASPRPDGFQQWGSEAPVLADALSPPRELELAQLALTRWEALGQVACRTGAAPGCPAPNLTWHTERTHNARTILQCLGQQLSTDLAERANRHIGEIRTFLQAAVIQATTTGGLLAGASATPDLYELLRSTFTRLAPSLLTQSPHTALCPDGGPDSGRPTCPAPTLRDANQVNFLGLT